MTDRDLLILARRYEKELVRMDKSRREYKKSYKGNRRQYFQLDSVGCSDGSNRVEKMLEAINGR